MKTKIWLTAIAVGMSALSSPSAYAWKDGGKTYEIPGGKHYAKGLNIGHYKGTSVTMSFRFDQSAIYQTQDPANQGDGNKLWGFTDCNRMDPQKESARFTWRWMGDRIEILAQVDRDGEHLMKVLGSTQPFEMSHGTIRLSGNNYAFDYKGNTVLIPRRCNKDKMKGFRLYPYFGGQETAPHDVSIFLQRGIHPSSVVPLQSLRVAPAGGNFLRVAPPSARESQKTLRLQSIGNRLR